MSVDRGVTPVTTKLTNRETTDEPRSYSAVEDTL
jgi:hypothetical protein